MKTSEPKQDNKKHEIPGQTAEDKKLSVEERAALGKSLRKEVPRSSHGDWTPSPDRPIPSVCSRHRIRAVAVSIAHQIWTHGCVTFCISARLGGRDGF